MNPAPRNYDEGIRLCTENAFKLLEDAEILLKNGSYGHALGLSILAVEEYGKKIMLVAAKFGCKKVDRQFWKDFRSHEWKLHMAASMLFASSELPEEVEYFTKLDPIKQRGFYVDYYKNKWVSPFGDDNLNYVTKRTLDVAKQFFKNMEEWFLDFEKQKSSLPWHL